MIAVLAEAGSFELGCNSAAGMSEDLLSPVAGGVVEAITVDAEFVSFFAMIVEGSLVVSVIKSEMAMPPKMMVTAAAIANLL